MAGVTTRKAYDLKGGDRLADGAEVFDTYPINRIDLIVRVVVDGEVTSRRVAAVSDVEVQA